VYGGFGVALSEPKLILRASKAGRVSVSGDDSGVFVGYARKFIDAFGVSGGVEMDVVECIPRHAGLGSGTQAALAVGTLISRLYGVDARVREIAEKLGRGRVSGVGAGVFESGGLVADGGHQSGGDSLPPIIFCRRFPPDWSFVVAVPEAAHGLSGVVEKNAMARVSAPPSASQRLSSLFLTNALPALEAGDVASFGRALTAIDVLVGGVFSTVQDGVYSRRASADVIEFMLSHGAYGAGQSSWGPAVYGLVDGENSSLAGDVGDFMGDSGIGGRVFLAGVDNRGARLEESCSD